MDYKAILKEIELGKFHPLYVLHGEEPLFIDKISDAIIENAISEEERDFNQTILYGKDADALTIMSEAKSFPFMGERKLIVLREAQDMRDFYDLEKLLGELNPGNIVVLCFKYKNLDGRKELTKKAPKHGLVFKSDKVRDYQLTNWISTYVREVGFDITPNAAALLGDSIGNELSRIVSELEKLSIVLEKGTKISEIHIEENIGISKDYNVFELSNALATRNNLKVFQIAHYFDKNPKGHEIQAVIPILYKLFTNLMRVHFAPQKTDAYLASALGMHPMAAKELLRNANNFPPKILAKNIEVLHEYDLKSKGVGSSSASSGDLLNEMLFQLLN